MNDLTYFKATRLTDRVTRIAGVAGELMYLAEGETRAALLDTGVGVGDLRGFVAGLTGKPLIVLITHGHMDHALGAAAFDEVYLNPADDAVFKSHSMMERRKHYMNRMIGKKLELIPDADYQPARPFAYHAMRPGDVFDLGGLSLEIFAAAGHSPGSVAVLLREERALLLGDACNPLTFLFDERCPSVEEYRENMLDLQAKTQGLYVKIYLSHRDGEAPLDLIASVIGVCDDIMTGQVDDIPFKFGGEGVFVAKRIATRLQRSDGGSGNIVYKKSRIYK